MDKKTHFARLFIFVGMFIISMFNIVTHQIDSSKQERIFADLSDMIQQNIESNDTSHIQYDEDKFFINEYFDLFTQNTDMVGWIRIDDTKINYPVMQSIDRPDFYLKHGFDKEYTDYGCPYVREICDVQEPSDNIVIYGHNMADGTMFSQLVNYSKKSFWQEHKTIHFDTLTDYGEYEILAVFKTVVYKQSDEAFPYYRYTDFNSVTEYAEFVNKCKELSLYDTGVDAVYGDKLITLSTCEFSRQNGRLVVVAKKI